LLSSSARFRFTDQLKNAIKWFCRSIDTGDNGNIADPVNFNRLPEPLAA
jgi:hypothetical protein